MPFLPSEGEETKLLINQQMKDVLVFHYLPILWYRYPIPNEIREFWYNERPDILDYMQKAYKDLDIQFLPDNIIQQLNQQKFTAALTSMNQISDTTISNYVSKIESLNDSFLQPDTILSFLNEHFHHLFLPHI
jgi:hypothetical protein